MRDKHRQRLRGHAGGTPGGVQELLKHPETSTATRWASRGKHTRLHAALHRSHTHTHSKQQASSHLPESEQSTNALKQVHKHLSRFLTVCTRMPYKGDNTTFVKSIQNHRTVLECRKNPSKCFMNKKAIQTKRNRDSIKRTHVIG